MAARKQSPKTTPSKATKVLFWKKTTFIHGLGRTVSGEVDPQHLEIFKADLKKAGLSVSKNYISKFFVDEDPAKKAAEKSEILRKKRVGIN